MALGSLRKASKSWVAAIFIGAIIVSFAFFGVNDIIRGPAGDSVARVGETEVKTVDFARTFDNEVRRRAQRDPEYSAQTARTQGLDSQILTYLVTEATIEEFARRSGLAASDALVAAQIRATPEFTENGSFDPRVYEDVLRNNGFTRAAYEELVRGEVARNVVIASLAEGTGLPDGYFDAMFGFQTERRTASFIAVTPAALGERPEPTESELRAIYEKTPARFAEPERRTIEALIITPGALAAKIDIDEGTLRKAYDDQMSRFSIPERRTFERVSLPDEAAARAALERVKAGATFAEIAQSVGQPADSVRFVEQPKAEIPIDRAITDAVFQKTETGLIEEPIRGALGYSIVRIEEILAPRVVAYESVRDALKEEIALTRVREELPQVRENVEDLLAQDETIGAMADVTGHPAVMIEKIDPNGRTSDGVFAEALLDAPEVTATAFQLPPDYVSDVIELGDGGIAIARVTEIVPPSTPPFEAVTEKVRDAWSREHVRTALRAFVEKAASDISGKAGLEQLAADLGVEIETLEPINRGQVTPVFGPDLVGKMFTAKPGAVFSGLSVTGDQGVIAVLNEVLGPDPALTGEFTDRLRGVLDQTLAQELVDAVIRAAQQEYGVTVNERAVAQAVGAN